MLRLYNKEWDFSVSFAGREVIKIMNISMFMIMGKVKPDSNLRGLILAAVKHITFQMRRVRA
jgi:hypothetical protein